MASDPAANRTRAKLAWVAPVAMTLLVAPVVTGLLGTLLPACGWFPPLGGRHLSLEPWRRLMGLPGLWVSVRLSFVVGLGTTAISVMVVALFFAGWQGTRLLELLQRLLAPLLSVPHVAVAFGLAFVLAPSGWLIRLLTPWATGFQQPPDWRIIQDPNGLALMVGLLVKEVPFLFLMTFAAMGQADAERSLLVARSFGYRPMTGWFKAVFPRIYPQIRLPILAVLAYGVSVVDVAMILGPTTPAPFAVRLVRIFNDVDLEQRFLASAGAILQLGMAAASVGIWLAAEAIVRRWGSRWIASGNRGPAEALPRGLAAGLVAAMAGMVMAGLSGLLLWSLATSWRFPKAWPAGLTVDNWARHWGSLEDPLRHTLSLALGSMIVALLLAVGVLESETRTGQRATVGMAGLLYLPLILPQIAFLFGAQILLVSLQVDGRWLAVLWMHLVFVFPYVFLSLADSYRAWDERYCRAGLCLGASPARVFLLIKLPMLMGALTTAGAVGFAVSVGLYLPTLLAGSGRIATLTTEAVTLSAGGDARLIGLYSILQMSLPLAGFAAALLFPAWLFRHRRGMQVN